MSREKDSKIVHELVTSKYKIAERNRVAKFRFLSEMKSGGSVKRRDSEPSMANTEKHEVEHLDISVPGTPVSSRFVWALRKLSRKNHIGSDSETDNEDEVDRAASGNPSDYHAELQAGLKNFTAQMEKLHDDDGGVSHDPLRKYFEDSDKKKTYRRDFSEVVAEFPARKVEPETAKKVEEYFQESDRLKSFKRDFTEVVRSFDGPSGDPFADLQKIGTPISSRLIAVKKLSSAIEPGPPSDIKISNGNGASQKSAQVPLNINRIKNKTDDFIKHESGACPTTFNGHSLKIIEESVAEMKPGGESLKLPAKIAGKPQEAVKKPDEAYDEIKSVAALKVDDYFKQSQERNTFRRNFSEVLNELGNHEPTKNPAIEQYFEQSDAQKSFQRPFSQVIQTLPPKVEEILKVGVSEEKTDVIPSVQQVPPTEAPPAIPQVEEIKSEEILNVESEEKLHIEEPSSVAPPKPARAAVTQDKPESEPTKRYQRSDSTASNISVPGTPVSSRELPSLRSRNFIDTDDDESDSEEEKKEGAVTKEGEQIKALAREFVSEIETLVQKSFEDDDRQEIVLDELKRMASESGVETAAANTAESDEKLIIQKEQADSFNPASRVEDYFARAGKENKYARTFSEVESFNEAPPRVKEKVESYFRESEAKKSFKRPFSEAVNYVGPKVDVETLLKPGTPVSSADVMCLKSQTKSPEEDFELDPDEKKAQEVFKKAHDVLHYAGSDEGFAVAEYFKQSQERKTYRRDFSEALEELGHERPSHNPAIDKYFEESDAQKSFQRPFSQVLQSLPPRIDEILKSEEKPDVKPYQRSSRASSVSSTGSLDSESGLPKKSRKHGKKYGIDKYFAASLYRTAYHRSNSRRESKDNEHDNESDLKIVEDEDVFGESDILRKQSFQYDDETRVTQDSNETNENQTVTFWRDFLKPYNLNLQTEITITKDELLNNNRTLE